MGKVERELLKIPGYIITVWREPAWHYEAFSDIISLVRQNQWIILGGDLLLDETAYAYASWHYEPDAKLPLLENVELSIEKCLAFANMVMTNKKDRLYVFTISDAYVSAK